MRGRQKAEPPLVGDLVARLQDYKTGGVVCRHCRAWVTLDDAKAANWWEFAGNLYCPDCAAKELGVDESRSQVGRQ